ncbi:hypothetical protein TI39_contig328g00026 [Zymoseptoria brevis]|uniref:Uncharacterized protein n=1 Tax=Zymoseptoria brevis TaxID=1047168 RepID=A0A0F4GTB5_9PEZI|nr:hypothetical protein TI39_contig328g00026 [Zymoseptoria brevis]
MVYNNSIATHRGSGTYVPLTRADINSTSRHINYQQPRYNHDQPHANDSSMHSRNTFAPERKDSMMETSAPVAPNRLSQHTSSPLISKPKKSTRGQGRTPPVVKYKDASEHQYAGAFGAPGVARSHIDGRRTIPNVNHDDADEVELDFANGARQIYDALTHAYLPTIDGFSAHQNAYYDRGQVKATKEVKERMCNNELCELAEAYAATMVDAVIAVHRSGVPRRAFINSEKARAGLKPELDIKCSERLARVVKAVKENNIIASDVLHGNFEELVHSPAGYLARKLTYAKSNGNRCKGNKIAVKVTTVDAAVHDGSQSGGSALDLPIDFNVSASPSAEHAFLTTTMAPSNGQFGLFAAQEAQHVEGRLLTKKRRRDAHSYQDPSTLSSDLTTDMMTGQLPLYGASHGYNGGAGDSTFDMTGPGAYQACERSSSAMTSGFGVPYPLAYGQSHHHDYLSYDMTTQNNRPLFHNSSLSNPQGAQAAALHLATEPASFGTSANLHGSNLAMPQYSHHPSNYLAEGLNGALSDRSYLHNITDSAFGSTSLNYSTGATEVLGGYHLVEEEAVEQDGKRSRRLRSDKKL